MTALVAAATAASAVTNHYLFIGHPRADGPGEIVQREVERIDFSRYDLLMLGGDYTPSSTASRDTVAYLDAIFDLGSASTLAALGNHDTAHRSYFTDVTGRPTYYTSRTNGIAFVVLDTTDDGRNILGGELAMLQETVGTLSNSTHLVVIHQHIVWMADYPPLAHLIGDPRIASSSATLSNLNFYAAVYPLLLQAVSNGVEVVCAAGDRTGSALEEFHIEHTTAEGVHYLAAGLVEDAPAKLRTAIEWEHDTAAGTLAWNFVRLSDLPRIPDEPMVITELHYDPSPEQGEDTAFVELMNRGDQPYDLSEASFSSGLVFTFPTNTIVAPGERILVAADPAHYSGLGVRVFDYEGTNAPTADVPLWLRDRAKLEIDYVDYGVSSPWPSAPDNHGPTLMLINPNLDNELPRNWAASDWPGGTPGARNFEPTSASDLFLLDQRLAMKWQGTVTGAQYRLDWTPTLTAPEWQPVGTSTNAMTTDLTLAVTNAAPQGYYRLNRVFQ